MPQRNYKETVDELKALGVKPVVIKDEGGNKEGDFYDYSGLRLENQFQQLFLFGQEYLDGPNFPSDKKPARFFFNEIRSVNACAYLHKASNYSIIEIFRGAIICMYDFYLSKNKLFEHEDLKHYKTLADNDVGYFLFQFATLYFFYHEAGHLVQLNANQKSHTEFTNGHADGVDVLISHTKEFDADWFSATCLANHILKYINEKSTSEETKSDLAIKISGLALCGIYTYYVRQSSKNSEFYTEKNSHPHPLVRLRYMVEFFLENLNANLQSGIDMKEVIKVVIRVSDCLMIDNQKNNLETHKIFWEKMNEINSYIDKIKNSVTNLNYLCINKLKSN